LSGKESTQEKKKENTLFRTKKSNWIQERHPNDRYGEILTSSNRKKSLKGGPSRESTRIKRGPERGEKEVGRGISFLKEKERRKDTAHQTTPIGEKRCRKK